MKHSSTEEGEDIRNVGKIYNKENCQRNSYNFTLSEDKNWLLTKENEDYTHTQDNNELN